MAGREKDVTQIQTKQPSGSAFKQQKLPAWQPILTAGTVFPTFFIIGLAFIPLGIGLLFSSNQVQEFELDYTYCNSTVSGIPCAEIKSPCTCEVKFNLKELFKADVYMYYGLTNYYQNHRRYVKSRNDYQLRGHINESRLSDCYPFDFYHNGTKVWPKIPIVPCGAIANSLFNDTLRLFYSNLSGSEVEVNLIRTGIAWSTDKSTKFKNPPGGASKIAFNGTARPPYWSKDLWNLDTENSSNNGLENEDLIVWMRTAALPTFRKLYRRINHTQEGFVNGLPKGEYILKINYNYPVINFHGTKRMILSNTSWMGGKNPFLGIAYIVVGSVCLVLTIIFFVIHIKFGKSTHDLVNITQRTAY